MCEMNNFIIVDVDFTSPKFLNNLKFYLQAVLFKLIAIIQ